MSSPQEAQSPIWARSVVAYSQVARRTASSISSGTSSVRGCPSYGTAAAGGGQFRGEAGTTGRGVRFEAGVGAELGVLLRVEEGDRRVVALRGEGPEQGFHLSEIGRVVVEGEAAVAPHRGEVVFVGQQADGARDLAAQDAPHALVAGVCHVFSPCASSRPMLTHSNRGH